MRPSTARTAQALRASSIGIDEPVLGYHRPKLTMLAASRPLDIATADCETSCRTRWRVDLELPSAVIVLVAALDSHSDIVHGQVQLTRLVPELRRVLVVAIIPAVAPTSCRSGRRAGSSYLFTSQRADRLTGTASSAGSPASRPPRARTSESWSPTSPSTTCATISPTAPAPPAGAWKRSPANAATSPLGAPPRSPPPCATRRSAVNIRRAGSRCCAAELTAAV